MHLTGATLLVLLAAIQQAHGVPQRSKRWGRPPGAGNGRPSAVPPPAASNVQATPVSSSPSSSPSAISQPAADPQPVAATSAGTTAAQPPIVQPDSTSIMTATITTRLSSTSTAPVPSVSSVAVAAVSSSPSASVSASTSESASTNDTSSSTDSGAGASGKTYTGDMTWFEVGLGACGKTSVSTDKMAAIPEVIYDQYVPAGGNPNDCTLCGKYITIQSKSKGPYQVQILDRCTGCSIDDLDLSLTAFNDVTDDGDGRVHDITWSFD